MILIKERRLADDIYRNIKKIHIMVITSTLA